MSTQKLSDDYEHVLLAAVITTLVMSWQGRLDVGYFARVFAWVVLFAIVLIATASVFHDD